MIETRNIDLVIQYALLVAGEKDDWFERQLGPIHLIKYVYLADLCYAKRNNGASFTGVQWQFYKFGPWSQAVNARIEPALNAIHAQRFSQESAFEDRSDWVRWLLQDEQLYKEKEGAIPAAITLHLRKDILKFGKDTASLLHYVYQTKPMLQAAPNELLDLSLVVDKPADADAKEQNLRKASLSGKKQKLVAQRISDIRKIYQERKIQRPNLVAPVAKPRIDDIFVNGIQWLDSLAGEKMPEGTLTTQFSDEVWKSPTRNGEDVS